MQYDFAAEFNEGHGIVGTSTSGGYAMGMVDTTGRYTPFYKEDGSVLVANASSLDKLFTIFHNGLCTYLTHTSGSSTYGVIVDKNGVAITVAVKSLTPYNEGVIVANTTDGKTQVLDQWGKLIWEIGSYTAYSINKGIIPIVNATGEVGFVNYATRSIAISPTYAVFPQF